MSSLILSNGTKLELIKFQLQSITEWNLNEITLHQTYFNSAAESLEASYLYPVVSDCAVSKIIIKSPENTIQAQIFEIEEAKEKYNDAIASGSRAYLAEYSQESSDLMLFHIGNLCPQCEIEVETTYVTNSQYQKETNQWRLYIPHHLFPRYSPNKPSVTSEMMISTLS